MKPDALSIGSVIVSAIAILGGQALEGGHISSITQPTAALIVLGGTLGAVMMAVTKEDLIGAIKSVKSVFMAEVLDAEALIQRLTDLARKARKDGLIALEDDIDKEPDLFLKKALSLAVDGTDPALLAETLETAMAGEEERGMRVAKVWESAGGFAPTVGILGAVLGLIHVMENLDDPSKLGGGIAVAFVATVYGVAAANLAFLPMANKLKLRKKEEMLYKEMAMVGVLSIQSGENVRLLEEKLRAALPEGSGKAKGDAGGEAAAAKAAA